jgi:hypothetical protein
VNQAKPAVNTARLLGATPADVRAILAYFDEHRAGWTHPQHELYRRLVRFTPGEAATDGWPPLSADCQRHLARESYRRESAEQLKRQLDERRRVDAERWESLALWRDGFSLAQVASTIDAELAEAIQSRRRRRDARELSETARAEPENVLRVLALAAKREAVAKDALPRPP